MCTLVFQCRASLLALLLALFAPFCLWAHEPQDTETEEARARLADEAPLVVSPIRLRGGSELTVISPERWTGLRTKITQVLQDTHDRYDTMFKGLPPSTVTIRLMEEASFYRATGAPSWTNALYLRGQILIPINHEEALDSESIERAVRHEYTHSVIAALSGGKCAGWLDEGLAQWAEGSENPALQPALRRWLRNNSPVPLRLLQGGFTKLDTEMVAAAYAQSLYALHTVIASFGFERMGTYFSLLRSGAERPDAFRAAFGQSEETFEEKLGTVLKRWSKKGSKS